MTDGIVLAHDYATQRGGAERVALTMAEAFPGSPMYTTLYHPEGTFPEFADVDLRPGALNKVGLLRHRHRLALPLLAPAVDRQRLDGEVLFASSTGWAHAYQGAAHTIVYCHAPARWLYQGQRYLGSHASTGPREALRRTASRAALLGLTKPLRRWDGQAARRADRYLANSTVTQRAVAEVYGIEAEVLPPPPALMPGGPERPVPGVEPGFLLVVARLMPYKNVDVVIEAVNATPDARLVVVGSGPDRDRLEAMAGPRVSLLGRVEDDELRWLYRHSAALVGASFEDYGLSPLEAGGFGRPSLVLRDGGYLDTVEEDVTGVFFDTPTPGAVAEGIREVLAHSWDSRSIVERVDRFSTARFVNRLHEIAAEYVPVPAFVPAQATGPVARLPRQRTAVLSGGGATHRLPAFRS